MFCCILLKYINRKMDFELNNDQLTSLFNPDYIHRGVSTEKLSRLGKIPSLQAKLKTNFRKGLINNQKQLRKRRLFYGSNDQIMKKEQSFFEIISIHLEDELIRLMAFAGLVSFVLGILTEGLKWGWIEGVSIFFAVSLVISLSSIDQYVNDKRFLLLKGKSEKSYCKVYRSGQLFQIQKDELVVGDILEIMGGDHIFVDGIIISGEQFLVDQSEITGLAIEVKKRIPKTYQRHQGADPFLLSGSRIMSGMGFMIVCAVGPNSYTGRLMSKIIQGHSLSPLKQKLTELSNEIGGKGYILGIITFSSIITHFLYQCFLEEHPFAAIFSINSIHQVVEAILITFTIDVALPESLPLLVTIALVYSAKQLQKENIFVKHLNQCETMGGIDNLILTQTGFITKNLLSVSQIFVEERSTNIISNEIMSQNTCQLLNLAIVTNTSATPKFVEQDKRQLKIEQLNNKTECALLEMSYKMGYNYQRFRINSKIKKIYSSGMPKKKMATIYKDEKGKLFLFVKGSSKFILEYCSYFINKYEQIEAVNSKFKAKVEEAIIQFQKNNQKIIVIAYKEVFSIPTKWSQIDKKLILIAIIGIKDIIRQDVEKTIKKCKESGINVRMVSSQNRSTAIMIAKQIGILNPTWIETKKDYTVVQGCDFRELVQGINSQKDEERKKISLCNFMALKQSLKVIYRASAEDKLLLALGLRQCNHVNAMAGYGTNDSQALRKADVSITMGLTSNELAKQASDIVILDDNFASIYKAIQWGRLIFNSIKKMLVLQLTINLVAAIMSLLGAIFNGESPFHAIQMLWINLIIDLLGCISFIIEKPNYKLIEGKSYTRKDKLLTTEMVNLIIIQSIIQVVILTLILFFGPYALNMVSSVGAESSSKDEEAKKHYTIFFNTFILLQIFNEFNARHLEFQKLNVFQGFLDRPLFGCFVVVGFIVQLFSVKYFARGLRLVTLSFNENLLCLVLGSISISGNFLVKTLLPKNIKISKNNLEIGQFKYVWNQVQHKKQEQSVVELIPPTEQQLQIMSPVFSQFLVKKETKYRKFSYIEPKDTLREEEFDSDQDEKDLSEFN